MSFAHLATIGTLSYNGYTFDGASEVQVNVEFVKDEAGRTILYHKHTIEVHGFVSDPASTDVQLESLRDKLGHQGKELVFVNKGFGDDLIVNSNTGGLRDVKWGPVPEILHWQPVGSALTCEIVWRVTTCVPVCGGNLPSRSSGVMAINYSVSAAIERGLTTRTISGYLEIAQTRTVANSVPDSADNYRYLINPDVPLGYERTSNWDLSLDRSRVNFTITDRQLPTRNPYPQGVTKIEGTHRASWSRGGRSSVQVRNSIAAEIEMALGVSPLVAWAYFGGLVSSRVKFALQNGEFAWLDSLEAEEDIFGLRASFSCSYRLLCDLSKVLNLSQQGLWQPIGTDWRQWKTSMATVFGNTGFSGLVVRQQNDAIVDLCGSSPSIPWVGQNTPAQIAPQGISPAFKNSTPPPQKSWLAYRQVLIAGQQRPVIRQALLQASDQPSVVQLQAMSNLSDGANFGGSQGTDDTIQQSGRARNSVTLVGYAQRAGYEIPCPTLQVVGGQIPVESSRQFLCDNPGNYFGVPVFQAAWAVAYDLPNSPSFVSPSPTIQN